MWFPAQTRCRSSRWLHRPTRRSSGEPRAARCLIQTKSGSKRLPWQRLFLLPPHSHGRKQHICRSRHYAHAGAKDLRRNHRRPDQERQGIPVPRLMRATGLQNSYSYLGNTPPVNQVKFRRRRRCRSLEVDSTLTPVIKIRSSTQFSSITTTTHSSSLETSFRRPGSARPASKFCSTYFPRRRTTASLPTLPFSKPIQTITMSPICALTTRFHNRTASTSPTTPSRGTLRPPIRTQGTFPSPVAAAGTAGT